MTGRNPIIRMPVSSRRQGALIGYCLMSNHVHLVVIPHNGCGLALALKDTHGRYAVY